MKYINILLVVLSGTYAYSQNLESPSVRQMDKLSNLIGHWEGEGWVQEGNNRSEFKQTEDVQAKLDGTTLLIEGNGYAGDSLIFQAMAVASYDHQAGQFRFNSFLADGKYTEASGKFNEDGSFTWQFGVPNGGTIKYNIIFSSTNWLEKGYYSPDGGSQWYPFLEMNLTKTEK
jgi:hypothetical protein